ncbi:Eukaryotic elongation factor 2 kinase [Seminavis robusta]|uniref:Eukaryotic elongation factor 2 kinase n=1 Tax=Seminavis robusta TaxID=568900 RepID=A0A9N8EFU3_9STRA|nr:Eukaryotic elongation factor 2 kinase [Seminavis robusta]|eukprot:Sro1094_g240550.1 Eukaryotic elongation factor 2 kinase (707) ;mRNA; r:17400-19520
MADDEVQVLNVVVDLTNTPPGRSPKTMSGVKRKPSHMQRKTVRFATVLETVHQLPSFVEGQDPADNEDEEKTGEKITRLTSEFIVLSSKHGRERRELREIDVHDLKAAVKYGVKTPGYPCRRTGRASWKYTYGNIVYVTDATSTREITSYKQPISISRAPISDEMLQQHKQDLMTLRHDPHVCATHSVIIVDQSGSMKKSDVKGFRNRSQAAYGVLALEYIAEQLYQRGNDKILDAVSVIEMNDNGTLIFDRQPMDWILFNNLLDRQTNAIPESHGNYYYSLNVAADLINRETQSAAQDLDPEDLPSYACIFLSDGKPSDYDPLFIGLQQQVLQGLADNLKDNFSFHAIGLGHSDSDFRALQRLALAVEERGSTGTYRFAALSGAQLTGAFTTVATSVTATRTEKTAGGLTKAPREKKTVELRSKSVPTSERKFTRYLDGISRWGYDHQKYRNKDSWPWKQMKFRHANSVGFDIEKSPFGQGAERLAYMFYEVNGQRKRVGKAMVAKETISLEDEERRVKFHETFCRVQQKSNEFAQSFNREVKKTPVLLPVDSSQRTPDIRFLDCCVYEYIDDDGTACGLLVEGFLKGKFTKFNSNNGYVKKRTPNERKLELACGEVFLSDFVQSFSHWVYVQTDHKLIVCDLQGVLNEEGRHPRFELTDPCINCKEKGSRKLYGGTNLGLKGLRAFRKHHVCTAVCKGLGLPPF